MIASITATAGGGQNTVVATQFASPLQALVADQYGNPVSGAVVTFTAPGSGAGGTFGGAPTATVATVSGVATAPAFTADTLAGSYVVTATVAGVSTPASFALTNVAGAAAVITATGGTPQSVAVETQFASPLQALVVDQYGNPVSGVAVSFTVPASGASGTFAGGQSSATVVTDSTGTATAGALTANGFAGSYTVMAAVAGVVSPASFYLTNTAGTLSTLTATGGTPQSATVNTAFATALQATLLDPYGNPVSGVMVSFTAPGSGASGTFGGGQSTAMVLTDSTGTATAPAFTANTIAGSYAVTATAGTLSASFYFSNLAGAPAAITATAGTPQSAQIGTQFAMALQAAVLDQYGNPVSGVMVSFTAPGSGASGTFAGGQSTAMVLTDSTGTATAPAFTANTTEGTYSVGATVTGVANGASYTLSNLPGAPGSIVAAGGTPQSAVVLTGFGNTLQALVEDANNNPVPNVTVTFTAPGSGASGTFAGGQSTATVLTDSTGTATAPAFTANATAGAYTVNATADAVATPASFSLTNLAGAPAAITAAAGTPQSASVGAAFATLLQALVEDANNNPVPNVTVTFTAPGSGASGTFAGGQSTATVLTDSTGTATAPAFTANGTAGSYTVTGSVSGALTPASFSLTNLSSM